MIPPKTKGEPVNKRYILIKAEVLSQEEKVLNVRLEDGFGNAMVVVHKDNALPTK
jgi:hypothetical protein